MNTPISLPSTPPPSSSSLLPKDPASEPEQLPKDGGAAGAGSVAVEVKEGDAAVVEVDGGAVEKKLDEVGDHLMDGGGGGGGGDGPPSSPATVFRIRLKQPPASLRYKMSVPELCRNFRFACFLNISCSLVHKFDF